MNAEGVVSKTNNPREQMVPFEQANVNEFHPDPLGAVGESFWNDVVGVLFPWELAKAPTKTSNSSNSIVGIGITFRRDFGGALLVHQIVLVCGCWQTISALLLACIIVLRWIAPAVACEIC